MSLVRHSAWAGGAAVILTGARFALSAIVARRLVQAGFGRFAYSQWLVDVAFLVFSFGISGVAARYVAEYRTRPARLTALLQRYRFIVFGVPLATSAAATVGALVSDLHLGGATLTALALWAGANAFWAIHTAILSGLQRFDLVFRANVLAALIMVTGSLALPLESDKVTLLFALMAVACAAAATIGVTETKKLLIGAGQAIDIDGLRGIRAYAVNMWITALLWSLVWSRGEMPIVRAYLGDVGVAHYAGAMTLFGGAMQGVMLAVSGVGPQLTLLWGSERRDDAIRTARTITDVQLLLCAASSLLLIWLGPELLAVVFGKAYRDAGRPLAVLAVGLLALSVTSQNHLLQIATDARFTRNMMLVGLALLFGFAVLLSPRYGLAGAALARAGTMTTLATVSVVVIIRRWGRASIGLRNVVLAAGVVYLSALVETSVGVTSVAIRALFLTAGLAIVVLSPRDRHGRALRVVILQIFTRLLRPPERIANTTNG